MASKRFEIDMALNSSEVARGADNAEKALEDLERAVEDTGRSGRDLDGIERGLDGVRREADRAEDALDDIADAADDAGRDGARSLNVLSDELDDLLDSMRDVQRQSERTGDGMDDIGDKGRSGLGKLKEATGEASDELKQNLGETFSSFRGDLEDLPQIAQDVFGGLAGSVESLGGSLALAAGAAGIGLLINAFNQAQEEQKRLEEMANDWADAFIDAGSKILSTTEILARGQKILTEQAEELKKNHEDWGVSQSVALLAMAGDTEALIEVRESLRAKEEQLSEAMDKVGGNTRGLSHEQRLLRQDVMEGTAALDLLTGAMDEGAQKFDVMSEAARLAEQRLYRTAEATGEATGRTDDLGNAIVRLPDGKEVVINAATQRASEDIGAFQGQVYGLQGRTVSIGADVWQAQDALDRWIWQNDGRTVRIGTKIVGPAGWDG